ncbi:condensation domain-containing protein [Streptomyces sp. NBC_01077]|uniref:condensation domain-containing protein n=1 Tax=Streptomyces sp. NBC_01077 TaxID=2903746 RepID=UPI003863ED12|nr:condensation domain-containing protein [Streptomyces sp. NBC_01077]
MTVTLPSPLSFAQERLWFVDASAPGNPTYNVPLFFRARGPVDPKALSLALEAVAARHEPLRTVFRLDDGRPVQSVLAAEPVPVEVLDLAGAPDAPARAEREARERGRAPFDLEHGPLLRCTLWQGLPDGDAVLLTVHHIAVDGWSLAPLFDDLSRAYEALVDGDPAELPALPTRYADFAAAERETEHDPETARALDGRVAELLRVAPGLHLAGRADRPAGPDGTRSGAQVTLTVAPEVRDGIAVLARSLRATPYVVLTAAVQALLQRWSGRRDFLLGTMTANRVHAGLEEAVGFFVNTVPLRCRVDPAGSFEDLCVAVRKEAFRSLSHQRVPFDRLTAAVGAARGAGRTPLTEVGFVYQNSPVPRAGRTGWTAPTVLGTGTAKFDLLLILEDGPEGLTVTVEYDTELYAPATAQALAEGLGALFAEAVVDATVPLAGLPVLPGQPSADALPPEPEPPAVVTAAATWPAEPARSAAGAPRLTGAEADAAELFVTALGQRGGLGPAPAVGELAAGSDFFALGGHSLLAVTMLAEAKRRHGLAVSPRAFLPDPTVAGLARLLTEARAAAATAPDRDEPAAPVPGPAADEAHAASPVQQRFWFLDRLPSLRAAYLIPTLVEYGGPVDRDVLRRSVDLVLGRHPALSSLFLLDRRKRHVCYRTTGVPAPTAVTDAADWDADTLRSSLSRLCWAPVDLAEEAPARAEILALGPERTVLALVVHHIVADGWSRDLLLAEIGTAYRALAGGTVPALPEPVHPARLGPPTPVTAAGEDESAATLLEHLRGAPNDIALPHDMPRTELQSTKAALLTVRLPAETAVRLRTVAADVVGCTLFMTTAALLAVALARRGRQRDFLFAFPWAGREDPAAAEAIGMFVNTLILRLDLREDLTWRQLLGRVRESCAVSYRHADVALDVLANELHSDRDLSRPSLTPVFLSAQSGAAGPPELTTGTTAEFLPLDPLHIKYELELVASETADDRLDLALSYAVDLFAQETAHGLLADVVAAAEDLAADPDSHPITRSTS